MPLKAITTALIFCLCAAVSATRPAPSKSKIETFAGVGQAGYAGDGGQANRIADRHMPDGGKIVFFTVSAGGMPSVGYIVYLDPNGKVSKVE